MENITSISELKNAIQLLEVEQSINGQLIKEQFSVAYKRLNPFNLFQQSLTEGSSSPLMLDNIVGTVVGLATGSISRKIFIGTSGNIVRKLLGSVLQFGVTTIVAQHPETVKSIGHFIFKHILRSKDVKAEKP